MRLAQLISELASHQQFATYKQLMAWLTKRAEELSGPAGLHSNDAAIVQLLREIERRVGYRCEFGPPEMDEHRRDDECWYCRRSVCEKHCGRRIEIGGGMFFSVCPYDVDKIDMEDLKRRAEQIMAEEEGEVRTNS